MAIFITLSTFACLVLKTTASSFLPSSDVGPQNFEANFSTTPQPFTIKVDRGFVEQTKLKAGLTRITQELPGQAFIDGVPAVNQSAWASYWAHEYDWFKVEKELNQKFHHFTTTAYAGVNYTYPIPLHFVHHTSSRKDAIPLLFLHGWPGTFHEVEKIIDLMTNPPNASLPAFHVVAPDLPGFGFSPAPLHTGLGLREMGQAFNDLMSQLGYPKYVGQGGDFGSHTLRYMASDFPNSVVSILSNLFSVAANATDIERYDKNETTPEETAQISESLGVSFASAYWDIEATAPLQIGIATGDSPIAWIAWQYWGMKELTPGYAWGVDELITWSMLNYIQGPYGGMRAYVEAEREGTLAGDFPYVKQPTGVLEYFGDAAYNTPLDWTQRQGNITFFIRKPENVLGGHFPATVNPSELMNDCWAFWGNASISGLEAFQS